MAKSLDHLIQYLLEEIALAGSDGITYNDFEALVRAFYDDANSHIEREKLRETQNDSATNTSRQNIDRQFLARIWAWLMKHPDVSVGPDHDYDHLTLDELDARFPNYSTLTDSTQRPTKGSAALSEADDDVGPRIHVNEERAYLAICGHPPDPAKVFPSEWTLLCAIAATRDYGILQGELGRITGQDKRSVPKRTDVLQEKGYIVKKIVFTGGHRTSRLLLKRFAFGTDGGASTQSPSSLSPKVRDIALRIMAAIKGSQIVPIDDIAQAIGMREPIQVIAVTTIIRHFLRAGCLKRVKTAFGPAAKSEDMKICYQLLRQPNDEEWHTGPDASFDFDDLFDDLVAATADAQPQDQAEGLNDIDESSHADARQPSTRPQWNIDRILPNVFRDVAHAAGVEGMTNASARMAITGPFVRRTLEATLVRVSHASPSTQPGHVRHLAVVRSSEVKNSAPTYIHRTIQTYTDMVASGIADWKDVGTRKDVNMAETNAELVEQSLLHDDFGFIVRAEPGLLVGDDDATLSDTISASKAENLRPGPTQKLLPLISVAPIDDDDDDDGLQTSDKQLKKAGRRKNPDKPILGRPRRFKKGTEKFWREMFMLAKREADPNAGSTVGSAGIMTDPAGLEVFNNRPVEFDDVLLYAITNDLPLPCCPKDVGQKWVDITKRMRDRQDPGWYITMSGMPNQSRMRRSCICVLRSHRLHEVDFSKRAAPSTIQPHSVSDSAILDLYLPGYGPDSKKPSSRAPRPKGRKRQKVDADSHAPGTTGYYNFEIAIAPAPEFVPSLIADPQSKASNSKSQNPLASTPLVEDRIRANMETVTGNDEGSNEPAPVPGSTLAVERALTVDIKPTGARQKSPDLTEHASTEAKESIEGLPQPTLALSGDVSSRIEPVDNYRVPEADDDQHKIPGEETPSHPDSAGPSQPDTTGPATSEPETHVDRAQAQNSSSHIPNEVDNEAADDLDQSPVNQSRRKPRGSIKDARANRALTDDVDDEYHTPAAEIADTSNPRKRKRVTKNTKLKKRSRELLTGRSAVAYYRDFVMQLVHQCQGVMPHDPSMLKRSMKVKCIEANIHDDPNIKLVRSQIKTLCDQGKLKQMYVSYRWNGAIHTKQILALPEVTGTEAVFQDMSTKVTSMPPEEDHIPPEMEAEQARQPVIPQTSEDTGSASDVQSVSPTPARRPKRRRIASEKGRKSSVSHQDGASSQSEASDPERVHSTPTKTSKRSRGETRASRSVSVASSVNLPKVGPNTGFLTLKVPGIASVRVGATFTSHYFTLPPVPLRFNTDATAVEIPAADGTSAETLHPGPQTRRGRPRRTKPLPMPKSLNDILSQDKRDHSAEVALADDPDQARFDIEVDWVAEWEMRADELNLKELEGGVWNFINHEMLDQQHAGRTINALSALRIVRFDNDCVEFEQDPPAATSWPPFAEALQLLEQGAAKVTRRTGRVRKRKDVETEESGYDDADAEYELEDDNRLGSRRTKRSRQSAAVMFRGRRDPANYDNMLTVDKTRRRGQGLRNLSPQEVHRLSTAIVMVRVLAGGLHHYIDWVLIAKLSPNETVHTLKQRWKVMATRFMPEIDALSQSFQVRYLDALANGEVPSVDFEDMENSDWQTILDWAVQNIDANSKEMAFGMLTTREELLEKYKVSFEERDNVRNLQAHGMIFTSQMRESANYSVVFGNATGLHMPNAPAALRPNVSLQKFECTAREIEDVSPEQSLARSFVLASLLTPPETFSSVRTHEKLLKLTAGDKNAAERLVSSTLAAMSRDKLISKRNKLANTEESTISGTKDWMINTQRFHMPLVTYRMVTATMLNTAALYKLRVLDVAFRSAREVILPKALTDRDDGEMLAILNLLSMGMIRVKPGTDVPASRYGLDWQRQGYKTKSMDNAMLEFGVVLEPTSEYVHGNVLGRRHHSNIPEGELRQHDGRGRIPAWFDINLDFRADVWELYISAVIGLVSLRPGISVLEICKTLTWVLAQEDVAMIMKWLEQAGVVRCTGSEGHWETMEWWWMILCKHGKEGAF